ncbi:hypothetical protein AAMO2058_000394000 [Amorphochlora amoebiformis]
MLRHLVRRGMAMNLPSHPPRLPISRVHSSTSSLPPPSLPSLPIFQRAASFGDRVATSTSNPSDDLTYNQLLREADLLSHRLRSGFDEKGSPGSLAGARVAVLMPSDHNYVVAKLGVWHAGGVCVPLYCKHPVGEMGYYVEDSQAIGILAHPSTMDTALQLSRSLSLPLLDLNVLPENSEHVDWQSDVIETRHVSLSDPAMIIYTSGTTGKPKGVVSTHGGIQAQILSMVEAWQWEPKDRILHFLPLHHVHGIVNKLLCPLYSGATVEFADSANPKALWQRLGEPESESNPRLTLFMAVPTIYARMIDSFQFELTEEEKKRALEGVSKLRLMVSGSAACPTPLLERWREITGHTLLERYGMTEIGMALTNPYNGTRNPGFVGNPFPGVHVRVVDTEDEKEIDKMSGEQGELRVKGPGVFKEYWNRPEATAKEFDSNGWFKTGDIVRYDPEKQSYQICGRASTDIIKTGGYKISALEIEREMLAHPNIAEMVVLGAPDEIWGERVIAVVCWRDSRKALNEDDLKAFLDDKLAAYKIPREIISVSEIPKNAMGKINKKTLLSSVVA